MRSFRSFLNEEEIKDEMVTKEDLLELIDTLDPEDYGEVAELMLDLIIGPEEDELEIDDFTDEEQFDEGVTAKFKNKQLGVRKFEKTAAQLKAEKLKNKIRARKNKLKNKLYRRKNKMKIKKYQKSRNDAIKKGRHKPKERIGAKK